MEDEIAAWVQARVKPKRFEHILGVRDYVTQLAEIHGEDPAPLRLAALIHDCERDRPPEEMIAQAQSYGIRLDEAERRAPILLHGPLAAEVARERWGIEDARVMSAVRYHTTGHPAMSTSDMLFYLADGLEPGRDYPGIDELRALAERDVEAAALQLAENSVEYVRGKGHTVNPHTAALIERLRNE